MGRRADIQDRSASTSRLVYASGHEGKEICSEFGSSFIERNVRCFLQTEDNMTKLMTIQPSIALLHHILAVSFATPDSSTDDIIQANVVGFICV